MNIEWDTTVEHVQAKVADMAAKAFAEHALEQRGVGEWRCARPGMSVYAFGVLARPGLLVVWGDLGEWVLRMSDENPVAWLRGAVRSPRYLLGKVRAAGDGREALYAADLRVALVEALRAEADIGDEDTETLARFDDVVAEKAAGVERLGWVLEEAGYGNLLSEGVGIGPSAASFWLVEALARFVELLP